MDQHGGAIVAIDPQRRFPLQPARGRDGQLPPFGIRYGGGGLFGCRCPADGLTWIGLHQRLGVPNGDIEPDLRQRLCPGCRGHCADGEKDRRQPMPKA
ncbi:hypothetical protein QP185_15135 [Sphingomonas aerolata]|uniref:hypothetical protein n=1 Tax=Sphingomonas aerolata TaxID=185951 RepID=UPI002FE2EB38